MKPPSTSIVLSPYLNDYPIDINIRIYPKGSQFTADVRPNGMGLQCFDIPLTAHELKDINAGLQREIEELAHHCEHQGVNQAALIKLATAGQAAFNRIFADEASRKMIRHAFTLIEKKNVPAIEIATGERDQFFLPWELLYDGPPLRRQGIISYFWGMRYRISRIIGRPASPGRIVSPVMKTLCPHVGLISCDELEYVTEKEIPVLQALHHDGHIQLVPLRIEESTTGEMDWQQFGLFLSKEWHILHFACHAYDSAQHDLSLLRISGKLHITLRDFQAREFPLSHHPLVILNACRTGMIDPLCASSWATLFEKYGARGVVATEFQVPDKFAALFIQELYKHLLAKRPVGDALILTRKHFWAEHRNPLGLAYALYSPLAIRISNV